jgi:hypothetical protein
MHYVGPSIVLMIGQMLKGEVFKSWNASFVMLIMWTILIQALKIKKCLITYYKTCGIIGLRKHVNVNHAIIAKKIEEEINSSIINFVERQLTNKRLNVLGTTILFFCC